VSAPAAPKPIDLAAPRAARSVADRLVAAVPVAAVYIGLCLVYAVESWKRVTPWLFSDELELTQLSRSIAATGHAARRGVPHSFNSLYTYLTAPLWRIHEVGSAYSSIKYFDVFVMASVAFPTYLLARMVVRRNWALFAAAGAAAIPSLAYSSYIAEETLAYPYAALCFYLTAKALVELRRSTHSYAWVAAAGISILLAPAVRKELLIVPGIVLLACLFVAWSSDWGRRRRSRWSAGDYVGAAALALGAIFVVSGYGSQHSQEWYAVTTFYKHRALNMGLWAAGTLAIAVGVLPFVAGLAALVRSRDEEPSRPLRIFRSVSLAALIGFGLYTALKAAYLSTTFGTRVEERNLIYVAPLLFIGTAVVLERRRANALALAAAGAFTLYLTGYATYHAVGSPYEMGIQLYSDALGFGILQGANRYVALSIADARVLLVTLTLAVTALVAAFTSRRVRERRVLVGALTTAAAVATVAWALTGEIAAAAGSVSVSRQAATTLGRPFSWVDDATGQQPTVYVGAGEVDHTQENLLEFWNRSIVRVTSFDGTAGGPGPAGSPNVSANGTIAWGDGSSAYGYAVESLPCVRLAGTPVASHRYRAGGRLQTWQLVRLTQPNRVIATCSGLFPDGWSGPNDSQYLRFSGGGGGWVRVVFSRREWSGPTGPSPVHVLVATLLAPNGYPVRGRVLHEIDGTIDSGQELTFWVRAPADRFALQAIVDQKFVPNDYNHLGDSRELGAQVSYRFFRTLPKGAKPQPYR
jgi:hypothetical protein